MMQDLLIESLEKRFGNALRTDGGWWYLAGVLAPYRAPSFDYYCLS